MSTDGLFQIWEGKKVEGIWYMYKTFIIEGKEVFSRQAFIPQSDTSVIRTSEHSRDGGKTWILRFKEVYKKGKDRLAFTLASYNAGRTRVLRVTSRAGSPAWTNVKPHLPRETRNYVTKIFKQYEIYKKKYF